MESEGDEWITPKTLKPLPSYSRAFDKDEMFKCVRYLCTMKAYHCINRQMIREIPHPRWTVINTICSSGLCRQGLEMLKTGWAQKMVENIQKPKGGDHEG